MSPRCCRHVRRPGIAVQWSGNVGKTGAVDIVLAMRMVAAVEQASPLSGRDFPADQVLRVLLSFRLSFSGPNLGV